MQGVMSAQLCVHTTVSCSYMNGLMNISISWDSKNFQLPEKIPATAS